MRSAMNLKEWRPALFMVLVQIFTSGQVLLTKVVVDGGSFVWTLLAYRFFLGAILALPLAMFFEKGKLKELKLKAFIWIFTSALVGFTIPGLYYIALGDTSPGYAINFYNIIPIATFILAVLFRKEPLHMRSLVGNIKIAGTLVCVGGTLVISLYKGKELHLWPTNIVGYHPKQAGTAFGHHHVRGTVLLITTCLGIAIWYTMQAQMLKVFPYKYWSTVCSCFVGSIQMAVVGIILNRQKATWELKWNMSLLTIVYSAILNTTAKFVMISWVVTQRGPTYPSMFGAVSVFFTTVLDSLLLGHDLSVGSILGIFMILAGLYLFLWGKRKESVSLGEENPKEEMQFQSGDENNRSVSNV
ncbi:WAT1-related protein At5g64700 [Lolium perenne]|uniref:WAT1-related protein At5g64700 n=1 Tax=Lolium perenne TaxID=4522 RepID=UPI0021F676F6|nr:WAT1-related protein At5g64700-like [Lolium perenne]